MKEYKRTFYSGKGAFTVSLSENGFFIEHANILTVGSMRNNIPNKYDWENLIKIRCPSNELVLLKAALKCLIIPSTFKSYQELIRAKYPTKDTYKNLAFIHPNDSKGYSTQWGIDASCTDKEIQCSLKIIRKPETRITSLPLENRLELIDYLEFLLKMAYSHNRDNNRKKQGE